MSRKPLTKELVIQAAMKIADTKSLELLSMRRLGSELGVEAMALYHYYKNKEQLLEDMLNVVHAEIITPDSNDWREVMRLRAKSVLEVLGQHPWAATIMESGVNPGTATMQDREAMTRCFRRAGFSIEATVHAITLLDIYVYGAVQQYVKLTIGSAEQAAHVSEGVVQKFDAEVYPYFSEVLNTHILAGKYNPEDEFYFGLNLVFDSIARLKTAS